MATDATRQAATGAREKRLVSGGILFAFTIFVSAFLLFQVQPLISKAILPWFGGSPAVWTTCMLFFQLVLLLGYSYAHFAVHRMRPSVALAMHLFLLAAALLFLPIVPGDRWKPDPAGSPVWQILQLLGATVGVPYFLLSTTGPLVQAWYHRWSGGASPYRLYALSNIGSLGALLTYPFLVEPAMGTVVQGWVWSGGFLIFAMLCATVAWLAGKATHDDVQHVSDSTSVDSRSDETAQEAATTSSSSARDPGQLSAVATWGRGLLWFALPALASVMLLASTSHISQDIAVFPFLWILPLSLYLLSFIICFDHSRWYRPVWMSVLLMAFIGAIAAITHEASVNSWLAAKKAAWNLPLRLESLMHVPDVMNNLWIEVGLYAGGLFFLCMVCHGEVVRWKPPARGLTAFYLAIAAGGAAGGILTAVVFPHLFDNYWEIPLGWDAGAMLAVAVVALEASRRKTLAWRIPLAVIALGLTAALWWVVPGVWPGASEDQVDGRRNFFGVLRVFEHGKGNPKTHRYTLYNGRILHGLQLLAPERRTQPTTYFTKDSGVGVAISAFQLQKATMRVGTIGLGAGTTAAYGRRGDHYVFYEINPAVIELNRKWFTFLSDMEHRGGQVDVRLGDARLTMEREPPQRYDVLAIDAFTGDAIPAHLLTREAFEVYFRHMRKGGVIAVHISNRHLDLNPVVAAIAAHYNLSLLRVEGEEKDEIADADSEWLLLTKNNDLAEWIVATGDGELVDVDQAEKTLWTDDYSSLWQILYEKPWEALWR